MEEFSVNEAISVLTSLGFLIMEMVVYAFLIFNYYRFLARRDIIKFDLDKYKDTGDRLITGFVNFVQTAFLSPIVLFVWFVILAAILGFLGKNQSINNILLLSVALISTVRVVAYYNEDLSKDLAKMLPFTLLGIFIVDQSYFNFEVSLSFIREIPTYWHTLVYYLIFIFILELLLRIMWIVIKVSSNKPREIEYKKTQKTNVTASNSSTNA